MRSFILVPSVGFEMCVDIAGNNVDNTIDALIFLINLLFVGFHSVNRSSHLYSS